MDVKSIALKRFGSIKRFLVSHETSLQILLLLIISSVIYLPRVGQLQYYKDDWYYVLDGFYGGPTIFNEMFSIDRPARGPFFQVFFFLFGANPLPYHLGQYIWHVLAAVSALWLFRMVWREQGCQNFFAASFFLIYPGYLWWVSGIEYQPMMASLFFQVFSIVLTVKAILAPKLLHKIIFLLGSVLSGWGYLTLVEYAIGVEFFRFALIFVLANRENSISILRRSFKTFKTWSYTSFLIPAGFLFWRVFFFTSSRNATNLNAQLSPFLDAPRQVLKTWLVGIVRDSLTVSVFAWIEPFSQTFWNLNLNEIIIGLFFACVLAALVFALCHLLNQSLSEKGKLEPVIVGFVSCFLGVIPVVFANR